MFDSNWLEVAVKLVFYGIKSSSNKHRSQLNPLAVPLNDAVIPLLMMLFVKELELVPYFKPVSVTMPVET